MCAPISPNACEDQVYRRTDVLSRRLPLSAVMTAPGCGDSQATSVEQKPAASAPAQAAPLVPVLAKAHLADADAAAKKWPPTHDCSNRRSKRQRRRTVPWWEYGAYSSSAKTCVVITIIRGNVSAQESGGPTCGRRRSATSSTAIRRSQSPAPTGVTKQSVSMVVMASPNRPGHAVWSVIEEGMRNPGDITLDIGTATGKVLSTTR